MPRKPRAQQAKAQNAAQGRELREAYKKATEKVQNATVEGFEDDNHTHKTRSPEEDPDIVEIISEFVRIQEDDFTGYASDPDLEDDEDDFDPLIEIQELTELEVFSQTLQKAHDAAADAQREYQKGNKRPKRYPGNSKRTRRRHEHDRKELEKKGFPSVIHWLSATRKDNDESASAERSSSRALAEPHYVSSDDSDESDDEVSLRNIN